MFGGTQKYGTSVPTELVSPWSTSTPAGLVFADLYPGAEEVSRTTAMSVPAIKRGRSIIVGSIADLPLVALRDDNPTSTQPAWLTRTGGLVSPWHRIAMTVDDLIFYGWSLWAVERGADGQIIDATRVPYERWAFDTNAPTGIRINNMPVTDPRSVILFVGPDEGVLSTGADVIRGARAIEAAWVGRVRNPVPVTVIRQTQDVELDQDEVDALVAQWSAARRSADGSVGFLPYGLELEVFGTVNADLFIEGRNAIRLDVGNLLNLPASLLDGSVATASLTYVTTEGQRSQLVEYLEYWLAPIEHRLSMDDVCPRGQVIRFDRSNLTAVPNDTHGPELPASDPASLAIEEAPA